MKPIEHHGFFVNGKLKCDSFAMAVRALGQKGTPVVLTVKEYKPTRSGQQNRYYWGVVVDLIYRGLNDSGIDTTREGAHELLRYRAERTNGDRSMSTLARICRYLRKLEERINVFLAPWVSPRKNYRDQWRPKG